MTAEAKGRIERSFGTAQDRLVKGLRVAGAKTLEEANRYLEEEFLPWWNQHLVVVPANPTDAHRPLGAEHDLASVLSQVETRQVSNDYTLQFRGQLYQIARQDVRAGLRGSAVRVEARLDGSIAVRFRNQYVGITACEPQPKRSASAKALAKARRSKPPRPSDAYRATMDNLLQGPSVPVWRAAQIDRTRTRDTLD